MRYKLPGTAREVFPRSSVQLPRTPFSLHPDLIDHQPVPSGVAPQPNSRRRRPRRRKGRPRAGARAQHHARGAQRARRRRAALRDAQPRRGPQHARHQVPAAEQGVDDGDPLRGACPSPFLPCYAQRGAAGLHVLARDARGQGPVHQDDLRVRVGEAVSGLSD